MTEAKPWGFDADIHHDLVVVRLTDRSVYVSDLNGDALGPVLETGLRLSEQIVLHPSTGTLIVARYDGSVSSYDWRTGESRWEIGGFPEIYLARCTPDAVLVLSHSGDLNEVDAASGEVIAGIGNVQWIASDTQTPWFLLQRKVGKFDKRPDGAVLEMRQSTLYHGEVHRRSFGRRVGTAVFHEAWGAIVSTSDHLHLLSHDLERAWRQQIPGEKVHLPDLPGPFNPPVPPPPEYERWYSFLSRAPDGSWAFALELPKREETAMYGTILDPTDGSTIRRAELSACKPSCALANGTRCLGFSDDVAPWIIRLPEMECEPITFTAP